MSLILNINMATELAQVSLAKDAVILCSLNNESQKDHASFLQPAIQQLSKITGIFLKNIDAIAITAGPGSYTGLRVGMASAKGLCYALQKSLIALDTLEVLAASAINQLKIEADGFDLFCPMIDARRMEVYTALFNRKLQNILPATALVLDYMSFEDYLLKNKIIFFGSGAMKWKNICNNSNASFEIISISPDAIATLAENNFSQKNFINLAYAEPFYLKEFQTTATNKKNS